MKSIIMLIFFVSFIFSEILHITSKKFFYNSNELKSVFIGDVNATKGKDNILADRMIIYFNKNKKPIKYVAEGNVRFFLILDNNESLKGKCSKLTYNFLNENIILEGNVFVRKIETNESVSGDKLVINRKTKDIEVIGNKKPVNIILKVEE